MKRLKNYISSAIQEFNLVTWPTRNQAVRISLIVFAFMIVSAVVLGVVDELLAVGYQALLNLKLSL